MLESAQEVESWTIVEFYREWCTSDLNQDRTIEVKDLGVKGAWDKY